MRLIGTLIILFTTPALADTPKTLTPELGKILDAKGIDESAAAELLSKAALSKCTTTEPARAPMFWDVFKGKVKAMVNVAKPDPKGEWVTDYSRRALVDCLQAALDGLAPPAGVTDLSIRTTLVFHPGFAKPPAVTLDKIDSQGGDAKKIEASLRTKQAAYTGCYRRAFMMDPSLKGNISMQLFVTPNGNVATSQASGVDVSVASCMATVTKSIAFDSNKDGGAQVNVKLVLTPGS